MKTKIQHEVPFLRKVSFTAGTALLATMAARASTDYGPAIWRPACSGHWYTGYTARQVYVIHDMEGYYASTISYVQGCNNTVSVHYCVNGVKDAASDYPAGEITQMVRDSDSAWTAGCWNRYAEQTEHEGFASNPAWYTTAMYQASGALTGSKADKYGIPKDRNHIIAHGQKLVPGWSAWAAANLSFNANCNTHTDPGPYWDWNTYMSIVGSGSSIFHLDAYMRGTDNALWHRYNIGGTWSGWVSLGGSLASDPTAVCWGPDRVDVFWRGTDNALWHKWYSAGVWAGPESLGGTVVGNPDACSWGSGHLDVYVRGTDNGLWHRGFGGSWNPWEAVPGTAGTATSDPSVVCWGAFRIDAFYRGTANSLKHLVWSSGWSAVEDLGGGLAGAPDVASWGSGRLDVFIRGTDNALYHKWWDSTQWYDWENLGGTLTSDPGAVSGAFNTVDIFARGTDNTMYHKWYSGGWQNWETLGGGLSGAPDPASWSN